MLIRYCKPGVSSALVKEVLTTERIRKRISIGDSQIVFIVMRHNLFGQNEESFI